MNAAILELNDVCVAFGGNILLCGITFSVKKGEFFCITGPSGSGKTLLLKVCAGLVRPNTGSVYVTRTPAAEGEGPGAGFVFEYGGLISNLTVFNNIALPLRYHTTLSDAEITERVREVLARLRLEEFSQLRPARLSLGARKLASIARAIAMKPQIIYYDEPTLGLDRQAVRIAESVICEAWEQGITTIVVTHNIDFVRRFADRVLLLGGGTMLALGNVCELAVSQEPRVRAFFADKP